jgi:hypothetical protein
MEKKTIDQFLEEGIGTLRQLFGGLSQVEGQFVKCEAVVLGNENSIAIVVEEFTPTGTVRKHVKHGKLNQTGGNTHSPSMYFTSSNGALRFHGTNFTPDEVQVIANKIHAEKEQSPAG